MTGRAGEVRDLKKLKLRRGTGVYAPGKARVVQILEAAYRILLSKGYASITLRAIAERCKIRVGAVTYYYKRREDLVRDLLEWAAAPHYDVYESLVADESLPAADRLKKLIRVILEDIQTENTTKFFPELWAMANHDAFVAKLVDSMYIRQRSGFIRLIGEINPSLGQAEREVLALFVSASLEGTTVFAGYKKPWVNQMPALENLALTSLVHLVSTVTNQDIRRGLPPLGVGQPTLPLPRKSAHGATCKGGRGSRRLETGLEPERPLAEE